MTYRQSTRSHFKDSSQYEEMDSAVQNDRKDVSLKWWWDSQSANAKCVKTSWELRIRCNVFQIFQRFYGYCSLDNCGFLNWTWIEFKVICPWANVCFLNRKENIFIYKCALLDGKITKLLFFQLLLPKRLWRCVRSSLVRAVKTTNYDWLAGRSLYFSSTMVYLKIHIRVWVCFTVISALFLSTG